MKNHRSGPVSVLVSKGLFLRTKRNRSWQERGNESGHTTRVVVEARIYGDTG